MSVVQLVGIGDVAFQRLPGAETVARIAGWRRRWDAGGPTMTFGNLEIPLTDGGTPADKPAAFRGPKAGGGALRGMGFDVVSLANNHALDYGAAGARDTMTVVEESGVVHVGMGVGDEASAGRVVRVGELRIGVLALCSTIPRGYAAGPDRLGVAPLRAHQAIYVDGALFDEQPGTAPRVQTWAHEPDLERAEAAVHALRGSGADLVVAAVHWGVPPMWLAPYQAPLADYQRPMAERLVAAGVDAIFGHHAHVPLQFDLIDDAPVFWSLGNFMFQPYSVEHPQDGPTTPGLMGGGRPAEFHQGYVARLSFGKGGLGAIDLETYVLDEAGEPVAPTPEVHEAMVARLDRGERPAAVAVRWAPIG